jgi:hypothetical protein
MAVEVIEAETDEDALRQASEVFRRHRRFCTGYEVWNQARLVLRAAQALRTAADAPGLLWAVAVR